MKNNVISIFLTVIIATLIVAGITFALGKFEVFHDSPEQTVENFYQTWLDYEGNPLVDKYYQDNKYLTATAVDRLDEIISSFDKSAYDPVLCAQDRPASFEIVNQTIANDSAEVLLQENFGGSERNIKVMLKKQESVWLIDNIICHEGEASGDLNSAVSPAIQESVTEYLKANISELSPEKEVLGGTFYITSVRFLSPMLCLVEYEDGHVAYTATVEFAVPSADEVKIVDFRIVPEENDASSDGPICQDQCGDGICQEMVCLGQGCPCAESVKSCPADCQ